MEMSTEIDRLDQAINITAYAMVQHKLPQILPTLKRLEAERDALARDGDAIDYAKRVLERGAMSINRPSHCRTIPSQPLGRAA